MGVWSSIGRRNQIGILTVLVLLVVTAAAGGCQAHQRPGALTAEEQRLLTATPLPYTVSVVPWNADPRDESGRDPGAYARVSRTSSTRVVRFKRAGSRRRRQRTPT